MDCKIFKITKKVEYSSQFEFKPKFNALKIIQPFHKRTRAKRCLKCKGCQRKENCGICIKCLHREKTKQACIYRKCVEIKNAQIARRKCFNIKNKVKTQLLPGVPFKQNFALAPPPTTLHDRTTPEIFEPRKGLESDESLTKKVTPFKTNGIIAELPSIQTFCNEESNKNSNERQNDILFNTKQSTPVKQVSQLSPNKRKIPFVKEREKKKKKEVITSCGCNVNEEHQSGPFYVHLGSARTAEELKSKLLTQLCIKEEELRLVQVSYSGVEGKNGDGCPLAKWIIRRTSQTEKYLVIYKRNIGHTCDGTFSITALVAWQGISQNYADDMYKYLTTNLNTSGFKTRRRCGANDSKTCMCQGENEDTSGASFTFGCSWSIFFNGCKFGKSVNARKFKMQEPEKEEQIEKVLQDMATNVSPLLNVWAPMAYRNMTKFEDVAGDCRIGHCEKRPFSGVTCCVDFCAHSHKDMHNMPTGTTMVCTLLKPDYNQRDDEQLHVLPLYKLLDKDGHVAPTNYNIPEHFLKSKLQERIQTEGKGKYVMPTKVNKSSTPTSSNKNNNVAPPEESAVKQEPKILFKNEKDIPYVAVNNMNFLDFNPDGLNPNFGIQPLPNNTSIQTNEKQTTDILTDSKSSNHPIHSMNSLITNSIASSNNNNLENLGFGLFKPVLDPALSLTPKKEEAAFPRMNKLTSKPTVISDDMGGVAIALTHGSFLVECAKKELHATTALRNPTRNKPTRISMVFYQHKKLNKDKHGYHEYAQKMKDKKEEEAKCKVDFDDSNEFEHSLLTKFNESSEADESDTKPEDKTPKKLNPLQLLSCQPNVPQQQEHRHLNQLMETRGSFVEQPPAVFGQNLKHNDSSVTNKFIPNAHPSQSSSIRPSLTSHNNHSELSKAKSNMYSVDNLISSNNRHQGSMEHVPLRQQSTSKLPNFSIFASRSNTTSTQPGRLMNQNTSNSAEKGFIVAPHGATRHPFSTQSMHMTPSVTSGQGENSGLQRPSVLSINQNYPSNMKSDRQFFPTNLTQAENPNTKQALHPRHRLKSTDNIITTINGGAVSDNKPLERSHIASNQYQSSDRQQSISNHCIQTSKHSEGKPPLIERQPGTVNSTTQFHHSHSERRKSVEDASLNVKKTLEMEWLDYYNKLVTHRQNGFSQNIPTKSLSGDDSMTFNDFCKKNLPTPPQNKSAHLVNTSPSSSSSSLQHQQQLQQKLLQQQQQQLLQQQRQQQTQMHRYDQQHHIQQKQFLQQKQHTHSIHTHNNDKFLSQNHQHHSHFRNHVQALPHEHLNMISGNPPVLPNGNSQIYSHSQQVNNIKNHGNNHSSWSSSENHLLPSFRQPTLLDQMAAQWKHKYPVGEMNFDDLFPVQRH